MSWSLGWSSGAQAITPDVYLWSNSSRTGDVLVVWKLDRLGRTLAHLVNTVQDLSARGVGLRVLTGQGAQIDTTTAAGRSRCRKPRCGWPRPPWRTATPPCLHSAVNLGSGP